MLRKLNDWVLRWANVRYGMWAIFLLSICEAVFFPIPPDILLMALGIVDFGRVFFYALLCSLGSVLGACLGYLLGWSSMNYVGDAIINFYGLADRMSYLEELYNDYGIYAVMIAGITFIPYKLCTITAGMFNFNFVAFVFGSIVSRFVRFYGIAIFIYFFKIK